VSLFAVIAGWAGAFLLLTAYALVSLRRLSGDGVLFQILNLIGSFGLGAVSVAGRVWPNAVVNLVWICVGVVVLIKGRRNRRRQAVLNQTVDKGEPPS
jgi:hypothetical protein